MNQRIIFLITGLICSLVPGPAQEYPVIPQYDLLIFNKQYDEALVHIDSILLHEEASADLCYKKGLIHAQRYEYIHAIECYDRAHFLDSFNLTYAEGLADLYQKTGQQTKAMALYCSIIKTDSTSFLVRNKLATLLYKSGNKSDALQHYLYLADDYPGNYYYQKRLGDCYSKMNYPHLAIRHYQKAHELNPDDLEVVTRLANFWIKSGEYEAGLHLTGLALKKDSAYLPVLKLNAYLNMLTNRTDSALIQFEKVLALGDSSAFVHKYHGLSHYQFENFDGAWKSLKQSLSKDSTDLEAHFYYAASLSHALYKNEAVNEFEHLLEKLKPPKETLVDIHSGIAEAYFYLKRPEEALQQYFILSELEPKNTIWFLRIGFHYDHVKNNKAKAREYYTRYLDLIENDSALMNNPYTEVVRNRLMRMEEDDFFEGSGEHIKMSRD